VNYSSLFLQEKEQAPCETKRPSREQEVAISYLVCEQEQLQPNGAPDNGGNAIECAQEHFSVPQPTIFRDERSTQDKIRVYTDLSQDFTYDQEPHRCTQGHQD